MRSVKRLAAAAALLACSAQTSAASACLSRQSAADMAVVLLPGFINTFTTICSASLPPAAFLKQPAAVELRTRLNEAAATRTASAAQALRRMSGNQQFPPSVSDKTLIDLMVQLLPGEVLKAKKVNAQSCGDMDQLIGAISPMSPDQIGQFAVAMMSISGVKDPQICAL